MTFLFDCNISKSNANQYTIHKINLTYNSYFKKNYNLNIEFDWFLFCDSRTILNDSLRVGVGCVIGVVSWTDGVTTRNNNI